MPPKKRTRPSKENIEAAVRKFAAIHDIALEKWIQRQKATKDWFRAFMKRNSSLAVRKPESTSLGRATSFNKENVRSCYDNLEKVLQKKEIRITHDLESR